MNGDKYVKKLNICVFNFFINFLLAWSPISELILLVAYVAKCHEVFC